MLLILVCRSLLAWHGIMAQCSITQASFQHNVIYWVCIAPSAKCPCEQVDLSSIVSVLSGVGAGESAIASLLSTNPDPDHVTHAHAGERPVEGADEDNSPSPSIDSDKENNLEMVNLLHPNTPSKASSPHVFNKQNVVDGIVDDLQQEEDQEDEEKDLLSETQKPVKVW